MKARLPIYAKILFWFFINLAVLGTAGWFVLRGKLRFSIFSESSVTERVAQVTDRLVKELPLQPGPLWTVITNKFSVQHGVVFYCYDDMGRLLAGPQKAIPPEIHSRLLRRGPEGRPIDRPGAGPGRPPRDDGPPPDDERPPRNIGRPTRDDEFERPPGGPLPRLFGRPAPASRFVAETSDPHTYWVGIRVDTLRDGAEPGYIVVSSTSPTGNGLYLDLKPFVWAGAGVLILSALIWFPFVRGITRSVKEMRDATGRLAEGDFAARVGDDRRDELGELGDGINRMAVRLKGYVEGQKRFLSDVAHELCAPTARLQMSLGILEQRAPESEHERLADVREEVEHMSNLVHELLQFSKASLGSKKVALQPLDTRAIAEQAIHREAGDTSQITLAIGQNELALADSGLLQRALGNLIRNAIRHAGHAGPIVVSAAADSDRICITVSDEGPGIPETEMPRIFDPFYRIDEARTRETGGVGLGLAIVKTCVEACNGTVSAANRQPKGFSVTISLKRPEMGSISKTEI